MRTTAVIPALNESGTVAEVVRSCTDYVDDVVVVDGGSHDGTRDIADAVIDQKVVCGIGDERQLEPTFRTSRSAC